MEDTKTAKEEFLELLRSTGREGVEGVIEDLEEQGFFTAPASAGHHLNTEGGLVEHSLNTAKAALAVWEGMKQIDASLETEVTRDSVIIASLLHDVCKSDIYFRSIKKRKNRLGQWEDCEGYKVSYKNFPMGHGEKSVILVLLSGEKSVYIVSSYMRLTREEAMAIRWHMGAWGVNMTSFEDMRNYDAAKTLYPLVSIVQAGDSLAASILERKGADLDEL